MASKNLTRDMTRIVMRKINEDKRRKEEAVRRYVAAIAQREEMQMRIQEMEARIDATRDKAREAGVSAGELRTASREARQAWREVSSNRPADRDTGEAEQGWQAETPQDGHPDETGHEGNGYEDTGDEGDRQ